MYINVPPTRSNPNIETDYLKWMRFLVGKCEMFAIKKVVFVSSTGVYPDTETIVNETTPLEMKTASQRALIQSEALFRNHKIF